MSMKSSGMKITSLVKKMSLVQHCLCLLRLPNFVSVESELKSDIVRKGKFVDGALINDWSETGEVWKLLLY